jgi:outer membrane protein
LPSISANVGYAKAWNDTLVDIDGYTGGVNLTQVIYEHSAWVGLDLAEMAASQADSAYASTLQSLITRVTKAYFDVLTAKDNYEFQGAEKAAIERQLEQTKQRFAVGLTAITDVHEAQAQYDLATALENSGKKYL